MAEASIPVDLFNPGQVFACLGFLEAADLLIGQAEGWFDWLRARDTHFHLRTPGTSNPYRVVLDAITTSEIECWAPYGYLEPVRGQDVDESAAETSLNLIYHFSETFPERSGDPMGFPIRLRTTDQLVINFTHWADGSTRDKFKLYAGNRSALRIARAMLFGTRHEGTKKQPIGNLKTHGISNLWHDHRDAVIERPFDVLTPMRGSFNFDPRGGWTAIDAGYSPNDQEHLIAASPVVEFFAALGMEHVRPNVYGSRKVRYAVWDYPLPTVIARTALSGSIPALSQRYFFFQLALSGKNKVVTFAEEESRP
ncbi:type I-G CRISPR-associated protein Cas8g2 [Lamprocystis purpurea]|jgi:CRISPR-associated protein Csx14|uniref:type I-G CRISPR-associated protein Cas8g2 n=1 Tax=Lamprocystis purpurea TaxID=61598 RepID=UPI0003A178FC|nr:type I-U CRISPR-associated protein Cas8c [Lamprocystis purpurea]